MVTDRKSIDSYNKNHEKWMKGKKIGHEYLEKPAMYKKLPDLKNKKVLCVGCGAGEECAYIKSKGAKEVIGIDISKALIEKARKEYPDIKFYVMSMEKIELSKSYFDFVYSSLALHYVRDWSKPLKSIRNVLKKNGEFLFSTHNPVFWGGEKKKIGKKTYHLIGNTTGDKQGQREVYGDYLHVRKIEDIWFGDFKVVYYHKPFYIMINEIIKSGFKIIDCIEPMPLRYAKHVDINFWKKGKKIPIFVIFKLKK